MRKEAARNAKLKQIYIEQTLENNQKLEQQRKKQIKNMWAKAEERKKEQNR